MKLYRVIKDEQGGSFGMGRVYTAEEWLEQAIDWLDADGSDPLDLSDIECCYQRKISEGKEQEVIDYIAEIWQLEFEEISQAQLDGYDEYKKNYHKYHDKGQEPVCFAEWLDNEWAESPTEIDLTNDEGFPTPDELGTAITDYLCEKYGKLPAAYGIEIKVVGISWEEL